MSLCRWQGGACDRETSDPSGLCSKHRSEVLVIGAQRPSAGKPKPDLEDYILKVREWDETGRTNDKLRAEILELQAALGITRSPK